MLPSDTINNVVDTAIKYPVFFCHTTPYPTSLLNPEAVFYGF